VDDRISVTDCAEIALEMTNIDRIKPNLTERHKKKSSECLLVQNAKVQTYNRHPESHVSFCEFISNQVVFTCQYLFNFIKSIEDFHDSLLVCCLGGCAAGSVNAVYMQSNVELPLLIKDAEERKKKEILTYC
jgi:hypothetical protein